MTGSGRFENTHWTLVLQAVKDPADTCARDALANLCETYWKPLYCFARRHGHKPHDAEDLTQAFFQHLLATHALAHVDPAKGSFRSFLLQCLTNFIHREWQKAQAQKRNPGSPILSFDAADAETYYNLLPVEKSTPEKIYERACALALLEKAIVRLRAQYEADGKLELYEHLKPSLMGDRGVPYRELAVRLSVNETALRMEICRMRKKLRNLLKQMLIGISGYKADLKTEFRSLLQALAE